MPPQSDLPEPVHLSFDSIFHQKFGCETPNYFSESPLNRLSFLRSDYACIGAALTHQSAVFLCMKELAPLAYDPSRLAYLSHEEVKALIGKNPFAKNEDDLITDYNSLITLPLVLFLGIDEHIQEGFEHGPYRGKPYFAVDITPKGSIKNEALSVIQATERKGLCFLQGRMHTTLNASEAAIYAQARSLMDWNIRNPFCAGCGQPTLSVNSGAKRTCPPKDNALPAGHERPPCLTRTGISNISFPRTDPTIIVAVISHSSDRILLGRQRRWPPHWYSTLAGFIESGENVEEAVRREVWEESGVSLGQVVIHSSQPWPYPASLMIGAISQALPDGETIHLEHDPELEDAQWFEVDKVKQALEVGTSGLQEEPGDGYREGDLRLPPKTTIANQLLRAVVRRLSDEGSKF